MTRSLTIVSTISRAKRALHAAETAPELTAMESDVVTTREHRSRRVDRCGASQRCALGGKEAGSVSAFIDCADGTLTSIGASPFPNCRTAPCSVEISHDGRHMFVVNTESRSISSYSTASDGSLALLETTPVSAPTAQPADAWISPDCTTLWVVDSGGNTVSGVAVVGGTVAELPGSPTPGPAGAQPIGIAVT
jgi:DNA-binding beta-propeller fold protein YncE